jgi:hypothetical protein
MNSSTVKYVDGVRCHVLAREPVEVKPVSKSAQEKERKAKTAMRRADPANA